MRDRIKINIANRKQQQWGVTALYLMVVSFIGSSTWDIWTWRDDKSSVLVVISFLVFLYVLLLPDSSLWDFLKEIRVLNRMKSLSAVLPLVNDLLTTCFSDQFLKENFTEKYASLVSQDQPDVEKQCEMLRECDLETQYCCMEFLLQAALYKRDAILMADWRKLEKYMDGLNAYLVGYIRLYYGLLVLDMPDGQFVVEQGMKRCAYLSCFGLGETAKAADVRVAFRKYWTKYCAERKKGNDCSDHYMEKKIDAYCYLFGLPRYKKSIVTDESFRLTMTPKRNFWILFFVVLALSFLPLLLGVEFDVWFVSFVSFGSIFALGYSLSGHASSLKSASESKRKRERLLADREIVVPLISYICRMNSEARSHQLAILKEMYSDQIECYLESEVSYSDALELMNKARGRLDFSMKRDLVDLFFKLTVADDGIKNDEWYFMKSLLSCWRFADTFVNYYINRYGPLRTEYDEQKEFFNSSADDRMPRYLGNYYRTLGLQEDASDDDVKRAYHSLALQHHPDLPKNANRKEECETLMARINEAYAKICR